MSGAYEGRQIVGMDLHRRRSVLVRMTEAGERLETVRISNDPEYLRQRRGWRDPPPVETRPARNQCRNSAAFATRGRRPPQGTIAHGWACQWTRSGRAGPRLFHRALIAVDVAQRAAAVTRGRAPTARLGTPDDGPRTTDASEGGHADAPASRPCRRAGARAAGDVGELLTGHLAVAADLELGGDGQAGLLGTLADRGLLRGFALLTGPLREHPAGYAVAASAGQEPERRGHDRRRRTQVVPTDSMCWTDPGMGEVRAGC